MTPNVEVLLLERKRPSLDQPGEWRSAREQAVAYLADTTNTSAMIYITTAVGLQVRFFEAHHIGSNDAMDHSLFNLSPAG
jgi:hypothetical protein